MKQKIKEFLESEAGNLIEFELTCPDELITAMEELGAEVIEGTFETNGWEYDWWQTMKYYGGEFVLSGCGYYGNGQIYRDS